MDKAVKGIYEYLFNVRNRLGHLPNDESSAIIDNLELQIHEALESRCKNSEPTADDVNAVLLEMDPPEAFGSLSTSIARTEPRPIVGKVALYISIVGMIFSIAFGFKIQFHATNYQLQILNYNGIVMTAILAAPSQVLAMIVGICSKGDELGRVAIIISTVYCALWLIIPIILLIISHI